MIATISNNAQDKQKDRPIGPVLNCSINGGGGKI